MRVCHVIESAGGGSGRVVLGLARHCKDAGDDVTVIYSASRAEPQFVKNLESLADVKSLAVTMQRKVGWRDALDALRLMFVLIREGPFDVIHSHSSKAGALARSLGIFLRRPVQVYTPHAFVTMEPGAARAYGLIERGLSWLSDAVIAVSSAEETHAREQLGIDGHRVITIANGIRLDYPKDREEARRKAGFEEKAFVVGFAGRMTAQKNPERLVAAFAAIAEQSPDARLAVVGFGPLQAGTETAFAQRGMAAKVHFFTNHDAREFMPGFDCLLCTSDYEGFPVIFLEALAAGVPVVTTPVGGAVEVVGDEEAGTMTSDFAPESLAAAVVKLASLDADARESLRQKVLERAKAFDVDVMGRKTRALYSTLLNNRRSR
ncbi:MAG: glycosyltransferase family 4 protein [Alphaproteobacteria bacterium]|nr:glycosyltransferase family 4 protein [Alphaproteobacteria bacterium]